MESVSRILKDEAIVRNDGNITAIRKYISIILLLVVGHIVLYFQNPIFMGLIIGEFIVDGFILYFLAKDILYFSAYPNSSFKRLDLGKSMRTYLTSINIHPNSQEHNNLIVIQSLTHPKTELLACVKLSNVALQIRPNYQDFLRRLYEIQSHIPFCVQISIHSTGKNNFEEKVENVYGHHGLDADPQERKEFSYHILISKTFSESPNLQGTFVMLIKMRQVLSEFLNVLEVNFPHFRFTLLEGVDLLNVITSPSENHKLEDFYSNEIAYNYRILGKTIVMLANIIIWMIILIEVSPFVQYVGLFLMIIIGIWGIYSFITDQYMVSLNSITFRRITLYPHTVWLKDRNNHIMLYHPQNQEMTLFAFFSLQYLNPYFRFNPNKYFRSLLSSTLLSSAKSTIILQNYFNRVLAKDFNLDYFNQDQIEEILPSINTYTRSCAGFYEYHPILTFARTISMDISHINMTQIDQVFQEIGQQFQPLLQVSFSHCPVIEVQAPSALALFIAKNRQFLQFGSHLPIQFNTGVQLSQFLEIPDEIHKSIPAFYPGEFLSPILHDEINFGHVINTENGKPESPAGISFQDLIGNMLIAGQDAQSTLTFLMQTLLALYSSKRIKPENKKHNFSTMLLFDYSGTLYPMLQSMVESDADTFHYFQVGRDLGINLFDTPFNKRNNIFYNYITEIVNLIGILFRLHDGDHALLQNVWENLKGSPIIQLSDVAKNIAGSFDEKAGLRKQQSVILSQLNILGNEHLKIAFDGDLKRSLNLEDLFSAQAIIIDLSKLGNREYRLLFTYAFLHQLLILKQANEEFHSLSMVIAFNEFHNFYNRVNFKDRLELFDQLIQNRCIMIAESNSLVRLHPEFNNLFQNLYCARISNNADFSIAASLLNHDQHFTNIYSKSPRKTSYHDLYLKTLDPSMVMVMRKSQRFPFIFQYATHQFGIEKLGYYQYKLPHKEIKLLVAGEVKLRSQLDINFASYGNIFHCIILFLDNLLKIQKSCPVNSMVNLEKDLVDLVNNRADAQNTRENIQKVREILNELIRLNYLETEVMNIPGSSLEADGFKISDMARIHLEEYHKYKQLDALNTPADFLGEDSSLASGLTFEKAPPIEEQAEDDTTKLLHKSLDDRSIEILLRNLPDITVQAKIASQQGRIVDACNILSDGVAELLNSIKQDSVPEEVWNRLQSVMDSINNIRANKSVSQLNLVIGSLEESYIHIPDL